MATAKLKRKPRHAKIYKVAVKRDMLVLQCVDVLEAPELARTFAVSTRFLKSNFYTGAIYLD